MNRKKIFSYALLLLLIPLIILLGMVLAREKLYVFISFVVVILSFIPFAVRFERDDRVNTIRMVLIAVIVALSVAGRFAFSYVPHFKPVTAVVIIAGIYLGAESGFLCGALSAVISNFIFGQGAWTPFQMFAWGMIGFLAGIFSKRLKSNIIILYAYGALSGILYSLIMDTLTTVYIDGTLNISRYLTLILTALPVTAIYCVSNVLFLILLFKPIGKRIDRITIKYGVN